MHIPDAYLSPTTEAIAFAVMVPIWTVAARRTARDLNTKQSPLLSIGAAFCFAIQMFNIPAVGGTTAHALGAALLAILVGPWAAVMGMTLTLVIQALLFGDGGILCLGANCFDMAFIAPFISYGIYRLLSGKSAVPSNRSIVAAGIGAFVGTVAASLCAGIFLGIQPLIAHDAAGHALYCPFGLNVSVPAMVMTHLLVAGPAEAIITVATLAYLWRSFPELAAPAARPRIGSGFRLARKLAWILVLTPIGLIASGSAFGEWDLGELKRMIGYEPAGIAKAQHLVRPLLPDYGFGGMEGKPWEILGYLVSAVVGCVLVGLFTRSILAKPRPVAADPLPPGKPSSQMPGWLNLPNPPTPLAKKSKSPWFETTILKMRAVVAKTVASEDIARLPGLLQSVNPLLKVLGFLSAFVATALARSPWTLAVFIFVALFLAKLSSVPLRSFVMRVAGTVAFFGLVLAIPVSLQAVTGGPVVLRLFGVAISTTGLTSAVMILLRLSSGIGLALLWSLTTRWYQLLRSLRSIGVPKMFITTAALTYRYLFVTMETLAEMVEARTTRQIGACEKRQARIYAGAGTAILFAKSLAFTEEMHLAMQSRSFDNAL